MNYSDLTHIVGPAIVTFDSQTWYTEGDISVSIEQATWQPQSSRFGPLGQRIKSLPVGRVSFKPDGQVTSGRAAKAFPYTMANVGQSIMGSTLTIQTLAGQLYTFARAGVVTSPDLVLAADTTAFDGSMAFLCLGSASAEPTAANSFLTIASQAFADTSFAETTVLSPGYTAAYGTSPFDAMESLDGFRLSCPISISEISINRFGTIGAQLTGLGPAMCRFTPAGMSEANWKTLANLDGATVRLPGTNVGSGTTDLVITGTGLTVTLPKCGVSACNLAFGAATARLGELVFHSRPVFTTGVPAAALTISVS